MIENLQYGNTNTFYVAGTKGGLLIDTDYAGTLPQFFKAVKSARIKMTNISYVIATHYHPDHIGIISELQKLGVTLLIVDVQRYFVHFADKIFLRDKRLDYQPIDETMAKVICCAESRDFLYGIGIHGEIIHTPSHSEDSVSIILDDGNCMVGDLEPFEYLDAYDHNIKLKNDWEKIMSYHPRRVLYSHTNEKIFYETDSHL